MQTVSRYLLSQLVIAYVNGYHGRNSKVYDRRLTLHRGVNNPITFTFKNEDQKAQDITSKTYEFNLIDTESKKSVLTKNLTVLDDGSTVSTRGDASCTITDGDLLDLDAKFYNFSVREIGSDGSRTITYSDTGYAAAGTVELLDTAYPQFVASTEVNSFTVTTGPQSKTSAAVDAQPGKNNNKALHSIAVYTKNFSGELQVQGTMVSTSPVDADYFNITLDGQSSDKVTLTNSTTVTHFNFTGVYQNVRFSWGNASGNTGKIDKILYRQ
jgi:hypothetical protein|tara:strand:+ start:369 stop:1175 length:807 start_codon:yes stop_codon:yes gene_type:complete